MLKESRWCCGTETDLLGGDFQRRLLQRREPRSIDGDDLPGMKPDRSGESDRRAAHDLGVDDQAGKVRGIEAMDKSGVDIAYQSHATYYTKQGLMQLAGKKLQIWLK